MHEKNVKTNKYDVVQAISHHTIWQFAIAPGVSELFKQDPQGTPHLSTSLSKDEQAWWLPVKYVIHCQKLSGIFEHTIND